MRVAVDATKCAAYGTCVEHAPAVFQLDEWGYASLIGDGTVAPEQEEAVRKATAGCPERAITITD
ncbi:ferredoxin [Luedemannella helvata]|uniref:Ferredoxin n=1 Tax=Luedemannella helvata TaxID=349315 RepID=A0ABP4W780_9ACTN